MKKILLAVACIMLLAGCGGKEERVTVNSLELTSEGSLTAWSVAAFDEDYLDLGEFKKEAKTAISTYNKTVEEERISLKSVSESDGILTVQMTYKDTEDYQAFNAVLLDKGNLTDLVHQGKVDKTTYFYDTSGTLRTTLGEILDREGAENWKYLAVGEPLRIRFPGQVHFMSDGAFADEEGWVYTEADIKDKILLDTPCYIIFEMA